ncbi:hypothetical protein TNCV_246531 [Trichonephila clavipes]|nr:hypothetical protein TNCV_246531 [Trichonephila clavipes]
MTEETPCQRLVRTTANIKCFTTTRDGYKQILTSLESDANHDPTRSTSILSYGCPVWSYAAIATNINILDVAQNTLIKMIVGAYSRYATLSGDVKIQLPRSLRLLACRCSSNCNDLLPNMKTQRSAMSLKRLIPV